MLKKPSKYLPALPRFARKALQAGLPQIIAMLFLTGFIAWAWTEPSSAPPAGNVEAPINVGPNIQTKKGDLIIGGDFKVGGDIIDKNGNTIYNSATEKIERMRLPF